MPQRSSSNSPDDTLQIPGTSSGSQEHRSYPGKRSVPASAESYVMNVLKEFSLPNTPSPTTAPVVSPSEPVGASGKQHYCLYTFVHNSSSF